MTKHKTFNIILSGVGGQGIITLLQILAEAAFIENYDVKTSELHGLSQRGGSVLAHLRFGKEVFSPLIKPAEADLILSLEILEAARAINFANPETIFLIDKKYIAFENSLTENKILEQLKKFIKNERLHLINASQICQEKLGAEIFSGIYLLGVAICKNLIPLKSKSVLMAIKKIIPKKYQDANIRAFNLARTK
ncbi:indolepyruvate oxidoreductase subunit beta [Patescibacteria group bacterium]|nr:indolepyruvate oxidoreductase subunit beta [Patescibacteria group bacterium]